MAQRYFYKKFYSYASDIEHKQVATIREQIVKTLKEERKKHFNIFYYHAIGKAIEIVDYFLS